MVTGSQSRMYSCPKVALTYIGLSFDCYYYYYYDDDEFRASSAAVAWTLASWGFSLSDVSKVLFYEKKVVFCWCRKACHRPPEIGYVTLID